MTVLKREIAKNGRPTPLVAFWALFWARFKRLIVGGTGIQNAPYDDPKTGVRPSFSSFFCMLSFNWYFQTGEAIVLFLVIPKPLF